jgi:hypothetical protein
MEGNQGTGKIFSGKLAVAEAACQQYGVTPENVDDLIDEAMKRFV